MITAGGVVTTLAGKPGTSGSSDGTGSAASFNSPKGVAVDSAGNVYVADTANQTIRKIAPGGVVTTLAGTAGDLGSTDGSGTAARFNNPFGIVLDGSGNIYVSDSVNSSIRKITPSGTVTTLAGTPGSPGSTDGTGAAARFDLPAGLAIDSAGNIYVADLSNQTIRKVTPAGVVTTLAGAPWTLPAGTTMFNESVDGTGSAARFYDPEGVAVDAYGNVFVADFGNSTIRMVTAAGVVSTVAGTPLVYGSADGVGSAAQFQDPSGIAVDSSGNLYITDLNNSTIRMGTPASGEPTPTPTPSPTPTPTPPPGSQTTHLVNLSVRSTAGTGSQTLIAGFVVGGSGSKSVLVRGDGPVLASFSVTGVLADPVLTLFNSASTALSSNSGWGNSTTSTSTFDQVFTQVGAFSLPSGSKDAAILTSLGTGSYTAQISSTTGDSGVVLVEVYDADTGTPTAHFINLSARSQAGTGSQTLIAGFAVNGSGSETVLIRGDGPGLSQFGVTGVLGAPQLTLYDSNSKAIATNVGWSSAPTLGSSPVQSTIAGATAATFTQVGAFQLTAGSGDCAIVATLPPGSYTAQVTGANNATGVALVEIYEVP